MTRPCAVVKHCVLDTHIYSLNRDCRIKAAAKTTLNGRLIHIPSSEVSDVCHIHGLRNGLTNTQTMAASSWGIFSKREKRIEKGRYK